MTDDIRFNRTLNLAPGVVDEVAPGVRRILVDNPSPFTFKGTRRRCNDAEVDVSTGKCAARNPNRRFIIPEWFS
jgi:hypothetical protein